MLVTLTRNLFERQRTLYATKDTLVAFIRQNERSTTQVFEQVNFFNRVFLDIEKIDPAGFEESSVFRVAELFTRYVEKVVDVDLKNSSFIVTKNNSSLSYHVVFDYALDTITLRSVVALFKALYPWSGIIDDVVYSPGRLFKCVGSYKPGMASTSAPADPETYHVVVRADGARVQLADLSDEEIASSLISNLEGANVISILTTKTKPSRTERELKTSLTIDGVARTLPQKKLHTCNSGKYSTVRNAAEVNELFSTEKIASVQTKSSIVKNEDYVELSNYCNNYNFRLNSVKGLKVYDKDLVEVTEGLDNLLLRCLLSRDVSLKVKFDDYIALAGNLRSVTWDEYNECRSVASFLNKEISRAFRTCENAVIDHIRRKFLSAGVRKEVLTGNYDYREFTRLEPKFGNASSLYVLSGIEEKDEFICLKNERYAAIKKGSRPYKLREFPAWFFTEGNYITNPSNTMFKLFVDEKRKIQEHRKSSYVNPYSRNPRGKDSDSEEEEEDSDGPELGLQGVPHKLTHCRQRPEIDSDSEAEDPQEGSPVRLQRSKSNYEEEVSQDEEEEPL